MEKADIVRGYFEAYRKGDRQFLEDHFADDLTFTSPYDDRVDKTLYFERCWPGNERIKTNAVEKIFVEGDQAFIRYKVITKDGTEFRNTEFWTFAGDQLKEVQVYFGATYKNGKFIKEK